MKTKNEKNVLGKALSVLCVAWSLLLVGGATCFASQEEGLNSTEENAPANVLGSDSLSVLDKIDLKSFFSQPVRIPINSFRYENPPGADVDYLYVFPPRFFFDETNKKIITIPMKSVFLSSGQKIEEEKAVFVRDGVEKFFNEELAGKDSLILVLREKLLGFSSSSSPLGREEKEKKNRLVSFLLSFFKLAQAENVTSQVAQITPENPLFKEVLDSENLSVRQSLMLLPLSLTYSGAMAEAVNEEKKNCLERGGEWMNDECSLKEELGAEAEKSCRESGGIWQKVSSPREICLAQCGMTETLCTEEISKRNIKDIGCVCSANQCVDRSGKCVPRDQSQKDTDQDGVPDGLDRCPLKTVGEPIETVNRDPSSLYYGCTCTDLEANGLLKVRNCPPNSCEGDYFVSYVPAVGRDSCKNGELVPFVCVPNRSFEAEKCSSSAGPVLENGPSGQLMGIIAGINKFKTLPANEQTLAEFGLPLIPKSKDVDNANLPPIPGENSNQNSAFLPPLPAGGEENPVGNPAENKKVIDFGAETGLNFFSK